MQIKKRKILSKKEKKILLADLIQEYGEHISSTIGSSIELEEIKADENIFIAKDRKIWFFYLNNKIIPSINFLRESNFELPEVVVDIGAIKFITNGADVMAPGVVSFSEEAEEGFIVVIKEEKAGSIIGVGISLINSQDFRKTRKGKVVKLLHHLKDAIWSFQL